MVYSAAKLDESLELDENHWLRGVLFVCLFVFAFQPYNFKKSKLLFTYAQIKMQSKLITPYYY